ncbi:tensin-1-like [Peromyscus eremicus]|uniref:tensin-1-like n=1 Tax=Peromyscus eremicus TaxID=42410 RepID=UPI0027DB2230|nr:tensin-1-like [Peromyscus eremicus]
MRPGDRQGPGERAVRGDCPSRLEGALRRTRAASQEDRPAREQLGAQPRFGHRPAGPRCGFAQPEELTTCPHNFKKKDFKKPRVCGVCRQTIDGQGIACRVCKYSCHKKCEAQVSIPWLSHSTHLRHKRKAH